MIRKPVIAAALALVLAAPVTALAAESPSSGSVDHAVAGHRFESSRHEGSTRDRGATADRHDSSSRDSMSRDHGTAGHDR